MSQCRRLFSLMLFCAACSSPAGTAKSTTPDVADIAADVSAPADVVVPDTAPSDVPAADIPTVPQLCTDGGWPVRAFATGPYGTHRHDIAADFTLPLSDGSDWHFADKFTGCETYVFVPDLLSVSELDKTSIWEKDLDLLIQRSPRNAHYFFVSQQSADKAQASIDAMTARVMDLLSNLSPEDGQFWHDHLHVVAKRAQDVKDWPGAVLLGHGQIGFGIDRYQRIRGFGMLADVTRQDAALQAAGKWPWKSNLAYAANEPLQYNGDALREDARASDGALVVPLWKGETLEEFAETDVTLTTALDTYDTLEIEVEMRCPNADAPEPGNCGAWDYIASLAVRGDDGNNIEIARFITSYHRETHWFVDASPMLVYLKNGGTKHFRWDSAPSWNKQPTSTFLSLRFLNKKKGVMPKQVVKLWDGGAFTSAYDTLHPDRTVDIPAGAKTVEIWALITGHGGDATTHCSEFCNHVHRFTVGGQDFEKKHPEAGTSNLCMPNLDKGMVPNQGGTWWYGRGGWCPGMQVDPWRVDITAKVQPGKTATLSYHGLLAGKTPPDGDGTANIDGAVWLVVYE